MGIRKEKQQAGGNHVDSKDSTQSSLLRRALEWILDDQMFADFRAHGNTKWMPRYLVALAVLTAWSDKPRLTDAFDKAKRLSLHMFGQVAVGTFQGMMRALATCTGSLLPLLWLRLHALMEQVGAEHYRIGKWLPLATDGSRFTAPRTQSNENAFAAKNFGKGRKAQSRRKWKNKKKRSKKLCEPVKPQVWLTLMWHMGLKLPWCWKTGPSTSSERHHMIEMLQTQKFPENTLFCCDAGFVGYELWKAIVDAGHSFLIRVGGNVQLLKNLGHVRTGDGVVYLWPNAVARRRQEPLLLRLIEVRGERGTMWLVTNVLRERELSTAALQRLYPLRWGVELQFRTAKQTFGRGKLRSRKAEHAVAELDWSLAALAMVQLLAIREQIKLDEPPEQTSVSQALRAIRYAMENWHEPACGEETLTSRLQSATKDEYERTSSKTSRYRANYKDAPSATKPIIRQATRKQKEAYRALFLAP
ncbi:MAG: transposase [Pirellulaceae bacterium]|nr:transposase [Pirellulaceae bacterium]